jgi:ABC-type sugar transport system ATPase subunit
MVSRPTRSTTLRKIVKIRDGSDDRTQAIADHKSFGPTVALDGVDLELREGEVHALIGENGAGKSTLMNVIAGSLQPDRGTMEINGQPYSPANPSTPHTRHRLIHQELSLCPHLSVAENVLMGMSRRTLAGSIATNSWRAPTTC